MCSEGSVDPFFLLKDSFVQPGIAEPYLGISLSKLSNSLDESVSGIADLSFAEVVVG